MLHDSANVSYSCPFQGQDIDLFPLFFILIHFSPFKTTPTSSLPSFFYVLPTPFSLSYIMQSVFNSLSPFHAHRMCVDIGLSNLEMSTFLKKVDFPYPSGHQGPIAPSWGLGSSWIIFWLRLVQVLSYVLSCL